MPDMPTDPTVREFVSALNAGDQDRFFDLLAPHATMSDDGFERDLRSWIEKEAFSTAGHMTVESESDGGLSLIARFRNNTWGEMRTAWRFTVEDGKITRFDTGQA